MKNLKALLLAPLLLLSMACSQQWREADDGMTGDEVAASIEEMISGASASSTGDAAGVFKQLFSNSTSSIYYAYSEMGVNTALGMPWNLLAIQDFSVFGAPGLYVYDLTAARIAFVDDPSSGLAGLAVQIAYNGAKTENSTSEFNQIAKFFTTSIDHQPEVVDGELVFTFNDGLVAKTRDVEDDGELKPVVQLKLYVVDSSGSEIYLGKITTLIGYD